MNELLLQKDYGMLKCFKCCKRVFIINNIDIKDECVTITLMCQCDAQNESFPLPELITLIKKNNNDIKNNDIIESYCFIHKDLFIEMHCLDCNTALCFKCINQHKKHQILSFEELWNEARQQLQFPKQTLFEQEKTLKSLISDEKNSFDYLLSFANILYHMFNINNEFRYNYSIIRNIIYFESTIYQQYTTLQNNFSKETHKLRTNKTIFKEYLKANKQQNITATLTRLINSHIVLCYNAYLNTIELNDTKSTDQSYSIPSPTSFGISNVFSDFNNLFALTDIKGTINLFDHSCLSKISTYIFKGHTKAIISLVFLNQLKLISCSSDQTIRTWDISTGNTLNVQKANCYYMTLLPTVGLIAVSYDNAIKTMNNNHNDNIKELIGHEECINKVIEMKHKKLLASCSYDKSIRLWDSKLFICKGILKEHTKTINDIIELIDSRLASASDDCCIKIWDVEYLQCNLTIMVHDCPVIYIGQLYNSSLFTVSSDNDIIICE